MKLQVIDVWAEWCAPCKKFTPIFNEVAKEFPNAEFIQVNADSNVGQFYLNDYQIRGIPTLLILDSGNNVLFQHAGILSAQELKAVVSTYYSKDV